MRVLVTGSNGFVGKNLLVRLAAQPDVELDLYDIDTPPELLGLYASRADFVFHLAGSNRPQSNEEFAAVNQGLTGELITLLRKHNKTCPVLFTSSIQAELQNPYGLSKRGGEDWLFTYGAQGGKALVYRLPNVFGKWCRPNYNSAVATFCYNLAHGLPITVNDPEVTLNLVYIDDVIDEFLSALAGGEHKNGKYCTVPVSYKIKLGALAELLTAFSQNRATLLIPDVASGLPRALYATYVSYLEPDALSYQPPMNRDDRGYFTELIKSAGFGQISVSLTKPGITRGNHWHHTKVEKFIVLAGQGVIRFRKALANEEQIFEYPVTGDPVTIVDIPVGYTHSIENTGTGTLLTLFWCNESFNPDKPDTLFLPVLP